MATVANNAYEEENQNGPNAQSAPGFIAGTGGAAEATQSQPSRTTGFVNLENYLNANTQGAKDMGAGVKGTFESEAKTQEDAANKAAQDFKESVQKKTFGNTNVQNINWSDPNAVSAQLSQQGINAEEEKAKWAAQAGRTSGNLNDLSIRAGGLDTTSGRQAELNRQYGAGGRYSQGMSALDSFLLGGQNVTPDITNRIATAQTNLGQVDAGVTGAIDTAAAKFEADRAALQQGLGSEYSNYVRVLSDEANARRDAERRKIASELNISEQDADKYLGSYNMENVAAENQANAQKLAALRSILKQGVGQAGTSLRNERAIADEMQRRNEIDAANRAQVDENPVANPVSGAVPFVNKFGRQADAIMNYLPMKSDPTATGGNLTTYLTGGVDPNIALNPIPWTQKSIENTGKSINEIKKIKFRR